MGSYCPLRWDKNTSFDITNPNFNNLNDETEGKVLEMIGESIIRKEAQDKVTGRAKYTNRYQMSTILSGKVVISPYAHARIVKIDSTEAKKVRG